jgi:hypothetical protein
MEIIMYGRYRYTMAASREKFLSFIGTTPYLKKLFSKNSNTENS